MGLPLLFNLISPHSNSFSLRSSLVIFGIPIITLRNCLTTILYISKEEAFMENQKRPRETEEKSFKLTAYDLIVAIISRLPYKDHMRFTCVSKSWCSLICTDPYFARLQIQHTASLNRPFLFIERLLESDSCKSYCHYWIDLDSIEDGNPRLKQFHINPFDDERPCFDNQIIGLCHNLLVLRGRSSLKMSVYNPTTKKHRVVPPNPAGDDNVVFCGFGYDHLHDCYKLVTKIIHKDHALELMVHEVNNGTWRSLQFGMWWKLQYEDRHDCYNLDGYDVECADGAVYWCIDEENEEIPREMRMMVCFVLAEEEFHVIEPPDLGEIKYYPNMTVLDGRLGLVCEGLNTSHEIWRIDMEFDCNKRRGSPYSWRWTKLLVISNPTAMLPPPNYMRPICFSACRNKILYHMDQSQFFWYDLQNEEYRKLNNPVNEFEDYIEAKSCVPSLGRIGIF